MKMNKSLVGMEKSLKNIEVGTIPDTVIGTIIIYGVTHNHSYLIKFFEANLYQVP